MNNSDKKKKLLPLYSQGLSIIKNQNLKRVKVISIGKYNTDKYFVSVYYKNVSKIISDEN